MRRPIRHRMALTLSVIIPGVLLTLAVMGLSRKFGFSAPIALPAASSFPAATEHTLAAHKLNIGVYKPAPSPKLTSVLKFGRTIGYKPDMLLVYNEWRTKFRTGIAWKAYRQNMILVDQIEPKNVSLLAIATGKYDPYLQRFATSVRDFGHQVIISFGHEMNGTWYSWSKYPPQVFVQAWQRIVTIFRSADAYNVTWMWTIHHAASGILPFWPGYRYVDIVGIDGYFETPRNTFQKVFGVAVKAIRNITRKPILIAETAVGPGTGHERADVRDLFRGIRADHLLGLVWFDKGQKNGIRHQNWQLESVTNRPALLEFKAELRYYAARQNSAKLTSKG